MPPGGHIDADETPEEAARRECKEETNLDVEIIGESQPNHFGQNPNEGQMLKKPIALLLENIPMSKEPFDSAQGRRNESVHQHMDFIYLARPVDESQETKLLEEEGTHLRWFTRGDIEALDIQTEIFSNVKQYILGLLV